MKKLLLLLSGITAILCFSATTFAAPGVPAGPYVGVSAGLGAINTPNMDNIDLVIIPPGTLFQDSTDDMSLGNSVAFRVFGGYLWNIPSLENLTAGVEAGYSGYAKNSYKVTYIDAINNSVNFNWSYKGYNIDLLGVAKYYIHSFNLIAKAGLAYVSQTYKFDYTESFAPQTVSFSKTKTAILPKVAVGFGYDFNNIALNLLYDHVFGHRPAKWPKDTSDQTSSSLYRIAPIDTVQLGITYHFAV